MIGHLALKGFMYFSTSAEVSPRGNHEQYEYTHSQNGELCLNGSKLIFIITTVFTFDPLVALPVMDTGYKVPWAVVTDIYSPYIQRAPSQYSTRPG